MNSNGTLIDEKLAQKLKAAGLDSALISIHGENEKTHVKTVCVNGAFERTVNGIKALLNNDIRVVPNFVASHVNVSKLKETAKMLYKLGINHQAYSIFIPTPNVKEHELLKMTVNDNQSYFEQLHELNSKYEDLRATATLPVPPCLSKGIVEPEILEKFEFRTCPSGRQFMVVNVEGNASPCIQYAWNETYGSNIINNNDVVSKKLNFWKELFNTPEKCLSCGCKGFCNPCNMNILRENDEVLSPLSIPYPKHNNLTSTEAEPFKKKFEILIEKEGWNKVYKLKEYVIIREEKNGFLTLINPKIQGYTVLKNVFKADIKSNFVLNKPEYYRLLKAMDVIEESLINNNVKTINMETAPKYKILTEFVGWDFNNQDAVYCLRTDTAGRFFCLPNTVLEKQVYDEARVIYSEKLENIKRLKLVKSKGDLYV